MEYFEKQIESERVYTGKIVNVRRDIAELHNGTRVRREVVDHPGGVGIIPVDSDGKIIAVRQFRYPFMEELLEIPAGKLEPGEDPLECAVRELSEETGYSAGRFVSLGSVYPSPGFCSEILYLYLATDLVPGRAHPDENEFLNVDKISFEEFEAQIYSDRVRDAKTIAGVFRAKKYLEKR